MAELILSIVLGECRVFSCLIGRCLIFTYRLEKYASRGFAIGLPGLDTSLLHPDLLSAFYIRMKKKRDLLLRVLPTSGGDAPGVSSFKMPSGSWSATEVTCRKQKAKRMEFRDFCSF